jgi:DNA polymerase III epsilon subunit-like protein
MESNQIEYYISVDVETAGPSPSQYSLLAIGACTLSDPRQTFYIELLPVNSAMEPQAFSIHGLSLEALSARGADPETAMSRFADWLAQVTPRGARPVFVAFNAPFDWMFVCDYFHRYLGRNPFGHAALDIKALYMGVTGAAWFETSLHVASQSILDGQSITHNALEDARLQGEIFERLLADVESRQITRKR